MLRGPGGTRSSFPFALGRPRSSVFALNNTAAGAAGTWFRASRFF